jgi:hypothetical protein
MRIFIIRFTFVGEVSDSKFAVGVSMIGPSLFSDLVWISSSFDTPLSIGGCQQKAIKVW